MPHNPIVSGLQFHMQFFFYNTKITQPLNRFTNCFDTTENANSAYYKYDSWMEYHKYDDNQSQKSICVKYIVNGDASQCDDVKSQTLFI